MATSLFSLPRATHSQLPPNTGTTTTARLAPSLCCDTNLPLMAFSSFLSFLPSPPPPSPPLPLPLPLPPPPSPLQRVSYCGYLTKLDSRRRPGKRRWFVLVGSELKYYRSKESSLDRPRKTINLNTWCKLAVVDDVTFKVCDIIASNMRACTLYMTCIYMTSVGKHKICKNLYKGTVGRD